MADDKQVRIGISIDKSGAQQAAQTVDTVRKEFDTLKNSTTQAGTAAQNAARVTDLGWKPVAKTVQNVRDDVDDTRKSLNRINEGGTSFFRGISGLTGGALGEIAQTSRQIEEVTRGFQKMTSQGIGPLLQTLGPTVVAGAALSVGIAGITAVINNYNQRVAETKAEIENEIAIRQELRELQRKATTEEAQAAKAKLETDIADARANIELANKHMVEAAAKADIAGMQAAGEEQKKWAEQNDLLVDKLNTLNKALKEGAFVSNDAAKGIDDYVKAARKGAGLLGMSSAQLMAHLDDLKQQEAILVEAEKRAHDQLIAGNEAMRAKDAELVGKLKDLRDEMDSITKATGGSTESILEHVKAQEAATEAAKKATEAYKALQKAEDDAFKRIQQRNTDLATSQQKYEEEVANIEEQSLQKRAEIQQKYNDTLVSIAAKAAQDAEDRLAKLEQTRQDLADSFAQGEQDAVQKAQLERADVQIKAQRDERDALQEHLRALEDIRRNAALREQGFLLDRNFLGLLQSRMQTGIDIGEENLKYGRSQQDRKQALQEQTQDTAKAFEQERQVRLQAYQKQLADAQRSYEREMAVAQKARQQELAQAVATRARALQEEAQTSQQTLLARRKLHIQELQDIYDFGARKLKAERDFLQRAIDMIAQTNVGAKPGVKGRPTQTVLQFADGGGMQAGQWGMVNDREQEQFNGAPFPEGLGMFYPLQPGYVSNVSNSRKVNAPVTINVQGGANPAETARMVKQEVVSVLEKVLR